jgi:hypothetical protein
MTSPYCTPQGNYCDAGICTIERDPKCPVPGINCSMRCDVQPAAASSAILPSATSFPSPFIVGPSVTAFPPPVFAAPPPSVLLAPPPPLLFPSVPVVAGPARLPVFGTARVESVRFGRL